MRRALITGIGGQDGSLLAELLLLEGYEVAGITRRDPRVYENLEALLGRLEFLDADLLEPESLQRALREFQPQEIYNLASPSFVPRSWDQPVSTAEIAAVGVISLLEALRSFDEEVRFYQASSSEMFGNPSETPQDEETPFRPLTPYGIAKACGHLIVNSYRSRYGLFACCGIAYNHESTRRPPEFLPRKVARAAATISLGLSQTLILGDLNARRDWGWAPDYVRAMRLMLEQKEPDDYVLATGVSHSVRELVEYAFTRVGLHWADHVRSDLSLHRGTVELHGLVGDASKARERLSWEPSVNFYELIGALVEAELQSVASSASSERLVATTRARL